MLVNWSDIQHLLRSPGSPSNVGNLQPESYPMVMGQPILMSAPGYLDMNSSGSSGVLPVRRDWPGRRALRRFLFPLNPNSAKNLRLMAECATDLAAGDVPLILVVGGGRVGDGTEFLYQSDQFKVVSFDVYASGGTTFVADGHEIPLVDSCVDAVVIQAVLEHVVDPVRVAQEAIRVLRPGGVLYAETPFMQHVHEGAYDFHRFSHSAHRWLFSELEEVKSGVLEGAAIAFLWSVEGLVRAVTRSALLGKLVKVGLSPVRLLDRVSGSSHSLDAAASVYFLGRKGKADEMNLSDLVNYYKGAQ